MPCLVIKERDHPFGVWQLRNKEGPHAIKVTGPLSSNHGEIVHQWYLDGQGIALRSWWDVSENIASGHLVQVLPEYYQPANVWAVLCFKAGDVSESADNGRIFTPVFCRALPEFFTGACLINDSIIGLISG
ncbi:LysR family transcriptional regulator [Escherichia coli]|uniref:LysR family transcriptional regulator n=1 Tax=Escherichia coli TaxID=562 RepID=A0A2X1M1N3_ECOLX|nr:LysR family transcriptional regulator [Escherichia coli]